MDPLTLFDAIADNTCWETMYCNWCDRRLPSKDQLFENEIIIRAFAVEENRLFLLGYHINCYDQYRENEKTLDKIFDAGG